MRDLQVELQRAGDVLHIYGTNVVATETTMLKQSGLCKSDDAHILARARTSRARILYSHDRALYGGLQESRIDPSRGQIYQTAVHVFLLHNAPFCISPRAG